MEENEYRRTYEHVSELPCVFEKALMAQHCRCTLSRHFYLGDREGYGCQNDIASKQCDALLRTLRENGRFVLGITQPPSAPLPHNKEIRIQVGGLRGLQRALGEEVASELEIRGVVRRALERFFAFSELPFSQILPAMTSFEGRKSRRRK